MTTKYIPQLQQIFTVQQTIRDIHPFLEKLFPVAIVKDEQFFIYDLDTGTCCRSRLRYKALGLSRFEWRL